MPITLAAALALASQCAPTIAPETLLSVVQVESRFEPLAIGVNSTPRITLAPTSFQSAVRKAQALIDAGRNIDLGLAQINSRNLGWLGLSIVDAFDPCRNLAAAAQVLESSFAPGDADHLGAQPALRTALSRYNTGSPTRGVQNGYVAKVVSAAATVVPALQIEGSSNPEASLSKAARPRRLSPSWDVFGQSAAAGRFVFHIAPSSEGDSQ